MKKFYCYSKCLFDILMESSGFNSPDDLPDDVAIISIGAPWNEKEEHWFKTSNDRILNIDFDDVSPFWWNNDNYDDAQKSDDQENYFNYRVEKDGDIKCDIRSLNYNQARTIVKFIENNRNCDFYIHCSAGISRSQGVVRYVLDTYPNEFEINPDNPCVCPNVHVTRMLKRAYRELYNSAFNDESCKWDDNYKSKVKLNTI